MKIADDVIDEVFLPPMWPKRRLRRGEKHEMLEGMEHDQRHLDEIGRPYLPATARLSLSAEGYPVLGVKAAADLPPLQAERLAAERRVERLVVRALASVWENLQKRLGVESKKEWGEKFNPHHDSRGRFAKGSGGSVEASEFNAKSSSSVFRDLKGTDIESSDRAVSELKAIQRFTGPWLRGQQTEGSEITETFRSYPAGRLLGLREMQLDSGKSGSFEKFYYKGTIEVYRGGSRPNWDAGVAGFTTSKSLAESFARRGNDTLYTVRVPVRELVGYSSGGNGETFVSAASAGRMTSKASKALSDIPADQAFWEEQRTAFLAQAGTLPNELLLQGALEAEALGLGVNFDLVNQGVLELAGTFTNEWWGRLEATTREGLRAAVQAHIESGAPLKVLTANLEPLFGKKRAEMIAATEVTRLFAEGNHLAYAQAGVTEVERRTSRDERVCDLCGPLYKKRFPVEESLLPVHTRCRCWDVPVVDGKPLTKLLED